MRKFFTKSLLPLALLTALTIPNIARAEDQPHMQAALNALQQARQELQAATHDKGGHREKALKQVDAAISEVKQGVRYDNQHPDDNHRDRDHRR